MKKKDTVMKDRQIEMHKTLAAEHLNKNPQTQQRGWKAGGRVLMELLHNQLNFLKTEQRCTKKIWNLIKNGKTTHMQIIGSCGG